MSKTKVALIIGALAFLILLSRVPASLVETFFPSDPPSETIDHPPQSVSGLEGIRLGFWVGHPLQYLEGRSVKAWFQLMFLTEPYPSWLECLLTDYDKWSDLAHSETQRYFELLSYADAYPAIKISFMVGFRVGADSPSDSWATQRLKLDAFCATVATHPSCLSVGVMTEYAGFDYHNKQLWEDLRDVVNAHGLPFVSYRVQGSGAPALPVSEGFYDVFHTNYPYVTDLQACLSWATNPNYYIGLSAGYWSDFGFPGSSSADGQPRGYSEYAVSAIITSAVAVANDTPQVRKLVALCPGFSDDGFVDSSGVVTKQLIFHPELRSWIWNQVQYREYFLPSIAS